MLVVLEELYTGTGHTCHVGSGATTMVEVEGHPLPSRAPVHFISWSRGTGLCLVAEETVAPKSSAPS